MKQVLKFTAFILLVAITVTSCKKELSCEGCRDGNKPPVANAAPDQIITLPKDSVMLDGSASTDPDGTITSYKWTKIAGSVSSNIIKPDSSRTVVKALAAGIYQFELTATDNGGLSAKDTVQVIVDAPGNQPPVANAGTDTTINLPNSIANLDGSKSIDPDNNITAYAWTKISGPSSFNIANANAVQTQVTNLVQGTYEFELKVTDAGGLPAKDTIRIIVISTAPGCISTQWKKTFGGKNGETAESIQATADGGYIIAGFTSSNDGDVSGNHGDFDVWVIKLSSTGDIQWQKTFGGSGHDIAHAVQVAPDGGYIVAGFTSSNDGDVSGNHGNDDAWVVKLNSAGNIQWQKALGGSLHDYASSIQATQDGGYVMAGYTSSNDGDISGWHVGQNCSYDDDGTYTCVPTPDVWVVKLNSTGVIQWQRALGGSSIDVAQSIQLTADGGYIVAAYTYSSNGDVSGFHGDVDGWVIKLSGTGMMQWQKTVGSADGEWANSIELTSDGGYVMAGYTSSNNGDAWVVRLNSTGLIEWQTTLGGSSQDFVRSVQLTTAGGFIIAGGTYSTNGDVSGSHGGGDAWIVILNNTGVLQCQAALGGSNADAASFIRQTANGTYVMAGFTFSNDGDVYGNHGNSDVWVVKLNL